MNYPATKPYPAGVPFSPVPMHAGEPLDERPVDRIREDLAIDVLVGVRYVAGDAGEIREQVAALAASSRLWSDLRKASIARYVAERVAGTTVPRLGRTERIER